MLEKIRKSMDEAYHGIRQGASKITLRAEEKTKLTRISMQVSSMQKEMDSTLKRLGNRVYNFREERQEGDIFQDPMFQEILKDADRIHGDMLQCREEMGHIREDYETRLKAVTLPEENVTEKKEAEKTVGAGQE